jgi:uncharacterized protein
MRLLNLSQIISWFLIIILSLGLIYGFAKFLGPIPIYVHSVQTTKSDSFVVTGTGKAAVKPDLAVVTVGVSAEGSTVKIAQDQLNNNINRVSQAVKNLGIAEADIKTQNYNVNPKYDFNGGPQKINGYTASSNLTIKVRDVSKANQVIDTSTTNGANQVGGVTFDAEDKTSAENEARIEAVAEAKKKAEESSKVVGFKLGNIINYSENLGGSPELRYAASPQDVAVSNKTNVEPGTSEVVINVNISYEIQ